MEALDIWLQEVKIRTEIFNPDLEQGGGWGIRERKSRREKSTSFYPNNIWEVETTSNKIET